MLRVIKPRKYQTDHHLREDEGKKEKRLDQSHAVKLLIKEKGYGHTAYWPDQEENQPVNVVPERRPKLLILKKLFVVRETNEFLFDRDAIPVEKAEPERLKDRDNDINGKDDESRGDKKPGREIVAADVTTSSRLDNIRLADRALRIHVILVFRNALPITALDLAAVCLLGRRLFVLKDPLFDFIEPG